MSSKIDVLERHWRYNFNSNVPITLGFKGWQMSFEPLLIQFTQSDIERVVKTVRKTETRFTGYNEVKESEGKRDHAKEEIFLRENQVPLDDLPLEELNKEWLKTHLPALKSKSNRDVTVENYISNITPKHQFWIA